MEKEIVTIRAEVIRREKEGVVTVRLCDGFAGAEVVVHEDNTAKL